MSDPLNLLYWIKGNKPAWKNIYLDRIVENDSPEKYLQDFITLGENGHYEALITLISYGAEDVVMAAVLEKFPLGFVIREIEERGANAVFQDFIAAYRRELNKYKMRRQEIDSPRGETVG